MDIYRQFNELFKEQKNTEILTLLNEFRVSKPLTVEEQGWVYWNISDRLAILRQPELEYENHTKFVDWGKNVLNPDKLHWFVSDTTQALTLSLGNYFDEWYEWYLYACENSTKTNANRGARFESHRAAAYSLMKIKKFSQIEEVPFKYLNELIEEEDREDNLFAEFTYYTLLLEKAYLTCDQTLVSNVLSNVIRLITEKIVVFLNSDIKNKQEDFVLGSWNHLNQTRLSKVSFCILLNNIGCTLSRIGKFKESVEMFQIALKYRDYINNYSLANYLLAKWKIEQNSNEVLRTYKRLRGERSIQNELFQYVPELKEINWN